MTNKKTEWQLENEKREKERAEGMKGLTKDQMQAIKRVHRTLKNVLHNIREMDDIYLSEIRDMDEAMWKVEHQFNLHEEGND
jgi:ribosomal protein S2